jgi:X-Pro dipeptidyl-peptidase
VPSRHRTRRGLTLTVALVGVLAVTAAPAAADDPTPPPWLKVENGQTQPQFALADAIEQTVFVETKLDSDDDGRLDRVRLGSAVPVRLRPWATRCQWSSSTARTAAISGRP